jgi:hypothetical protein
VEVENGSISLRIGDNKVPLSMVVEVREPVQA